MVRHVYFENRPLGRGAGGTVYKGISRFEGHERDCAVKVMHPSMVDDPVHTSRFRREGIVGYELAGHPNVVGTRTFGASTHGVPCLVMDLEGPTFDRLTPLPRGSFDVVWSVAAGVIRALATLEAHGWVHGDINTGNIFLGRDGTVKLGDFAKSMSPRGPGDADHGTGLDRRDDRRGLGLVLVRLATGAIPETHPDGTLAPLPDRVPEALRILIHGLVTPPSAGGLDIAQARAYIDQHESLHARPAALLELAREALEDERLGFLDPERDWDDPGRAVAAAGDEKAVAGIEQIGPGIVRPGVPAKPGLATPSAGCSRAGSDRILALACAGALGAAVAMFVMHTSRGDDRTRVVMWEPDPTVAAWRAEMLDESRMGERVSTRPERGEAGASVAGKRRAEVPIRSRTTRDHALEEPMPSEPAAPMNIDTVGADASSLLIGDTIELAGTAHMPGVVISVDRGVRLSRDIALVRLRIQNHGSTQPRIAVPRLEDESRRPIPMTISAVRSLVASGPYWIVPDGVEARIALEVRGAEGLSGQRVTLELIDPDGEVLATIEDIRWP